MRRRLLVGCGAVLLLVPLLAVGLSWRAGRDVRHLEDRLAEDVAAYRDGLPHERPAIGGPAVEGNAARLYAELEPTFGIVPEDPTLGPSVDLATPFADLEAYLAGEVPEPPELRRFRSRHAPLVLAACRAGVRRTTYDFGLEIEQGTSAPLPNLLAYRAAAGLLAVEAHRGETASAVRIGVEIVAFGSDLAHGGTSIQLLMGLDIEALGLRTVRRALEREVLPAELYREVARNLLTIDRSSLTTAQVLEVDRLIAGTELVRQLDEEEGPGDRVVGVGIDRLDEAIVAWGWPTYDRLVRRLAAASTLPWPAYRAVADGVEARIATTWNPVVRRLLPGMTGLHACVLHGRAARRAVALGAAAFAARAERGTFPSSVGELTRVLPRLPLDPFLPATPLAYETLEDGGTIRVAARHAPGERSDHWAVASPAAVRLVWPGGPGNP